MKIAIDCDNVLFKNTIINDVVSQLSLNSSILKKYSWDLNELGYMGKQECIKRFNDAKYMCQLKPYKGVKHKIKDWVSRGYELTCITSRNTNISIETVNMIQKHFPIKNIIVLGHINKVKYVSDYDVIIDDCPQVITSALSSNIKHIYLVSNKLTPYNHNYDFKDSRVVKVKGISDINI